jgi:hypothetical protein
LQALLDVLADGLRVPTLTRALPLLTTDALASRLVRCLADAERPLQAPALAGAANLSADDAQFGRSVAMLHEAGLVEQRRIGSAVWVTLLPLGEEAARALPPIRSGEPA